MQHAPRPFATVAKMDAILVSNSNATVGPDDDVWHLGRVVHGTQRAETIQPRLGHKMRAGLGLIAGLCRTQA
ncbi:hypothetical protein [Komagataeibacter xylinus]|nr:hypothetical protein [Komagataeibacter xylinus]